MGNISCVNLGHVDLNPNIVGSRGASWTTNFLMHVHLFGWLLKKNQKILLICFRRVFTLQKHPHLVLRLGLVNNKNCSANIVTYTKEGNSRLPVASRITIILMAILFWK